MMAIDGRMVQNDGLIIMVIMSINVNGETNRLVANQLTEWLISD